MARAGTSCTEACFREGICLFKISLRTASQEEWGETENRRAKRAERGLVRENSGPQTCSRPRFFAPVHFGAFLGLI